MERDSKIYVAGHRGLVGSAIVRNLQGRGFRNIIVRTHSELDLINQESVNKFFQEEMPDYVFLAAAKVGGINANNLYPADFIYKNLQIQNNVIHFAHENKVKKLMFLGSSCIYPRECPQPIKEEYLLSGYLEPTNEAYAIAKISGLNMCRSYKRQFGDDFISCMPTNLYGPKDNFDLETSHVLPALIRKFHEAKISNMPYVEIWGSGNPLREFLYVDDMADACIFLMENYEGTEHINIGTGEEISIRELCILIQRIVGFKGELLFNPEKPDGAPRKLSDVSKIHEIGWRHRVKLEEGIKLTYSWYTKNIYNTILGDRRIEA